MLSLLLERHFLQTYQATLTEYFYGLKRERYSAGGVEYERTRLGATDGLREALKLRKSDILRSLAITVGLSYLKRKLDEAYLIHVQARDLLGPRHRRDQLPPNPTLRQRSFYAYKWFLRKVYPKTNAFYYAALLCYNLLYLSGRSEFSDPFMRLINLRLRRLSSADHRKIRETLDMEGAKLVASDNRSSVVTSLETIKTQATYALGLLLPTSIFALKLLEWWHATDFGRQITLRAEEGYELPPPTSANPTWNAEELNAQNTDMTDPSVTKHRQRDTELSPAAEARYSLHSERRILTVPLSPDSSLCSICLWPINTATATQTGYAFCYTCIFKWIEGSHTQQLKALEDHNPAHSEAMEDGHGRCPITGKLLLGGTNGLRKIIV